MASKGFNVTVYLDDFYISAPTRELCQTALNTLLELLSRLVFYIAYGKVDGPAQDKETGQQLSNQATAAQIVSVLATKQPCNRPKMQLPYTTKQLSN